MDCIIEFLFILLATHFDEIAGQLPVHRRFEYKHSFRAPDLAQRDGSIPFWTIAGDAIASNEQLRVAPSMRSRKGIAWNKRPMIESENFVIEIALKISGQGRIGADGLAIWYTSQLGTIGPVFGANDYWTGMGLFLDSFDNDGQKNNPFVSVMLNDATRQYDHQSDGSQQILSGCQKDFRNKPYPVRLKVEYSLHVLTVYISDGLQPNARFELCIRAENIFLPQGGYFGLSAATGGLADDHDVIEFSVFSLFTDEQRPKKGALPQDIKQQYDAEFEQQMKEYEMEKQRFKEQHPDKVKDDEEDVAKYYEDTAQRELRLLYESQNAIYQVMQQMDNKLREIAQQQSAHTSMLSTCGTSAGQAPGGQPAGQVIAGGVGFLPHEKNEALQALRDLTSSIRDMKSYVNEIFTRTYNIDQKLSGKAIPGPPSGGHIDSSALHHSIESMHNDVREIRSAQITQSGFAAVSNCPNFHCISLSLFLFVSVAQIAVIVGVFLLKNRQEKTKFY